MRVAAILLAAGGSTRLGSPKQLLTYEGKSLLRRAAEAARAAADGPVVVVLGAGAERLRGELDGLDVEAVENPAWSQGMGTGVRLGMARAEARAAGDGVAAVLLTLCDQPLVGAAALGRVVEAWRREARPETLAAAAYGGTVGVPVVVGRAYFDALRGLPDDGGAKPILRRHREAVIEVAMPEAATDIDTREQYERLAGR